MPIIVAPDSYKGSLSAVEVAQAMSRGIQRVFPDVEVRQIPIADGGEGTVDALLAATGGQRRRSLVRGPLGQPVEAEWGILGDGRTAVIEMAAASGLPLIDPEHRDPRLTSTFGTGQLLSTALDAGLRKIILGIGGSATNDGGTGMARALGIRFTDGDGNDLPEGGAALAGLQRIDMSRADRRLSSSEIIVACDVDNPLCGPRGASAVFGPQKGATPEMVVELDAALAHYAEISRLVTGRDVVDLAGSGAAGGLGAGLLLFTPAQLRPGVDIVLEAVNFTERVKNAAFVITGEGHTDFQTVFGKAPVGVAKAAKRHGVAVFCLSGGIGRGADEVLANGIDAMLSICDRPMTLEESMRSAPMLIENAAERLCRVIRTVQLWN
ncbi:MAG TPA: glycerate kinase [Accumulibacter sp.]|nr:glycerate kinase [Accumulibacter sp.]HMW18066.1 glycerate kinase [Accumulibacter sp.]HMY06670.1 glycerate kinase [Accumulibacter sp.]HNC18152.1 glycerate kinase [Accumulibacter sp.]HND80699.1 glycerate kinase [Accumulibacter sp.]